MSSSINSSSTDEKRQAGIIGMFDRISGRYDLLNRTLSAGIDKSWRRKMAQTARCTDSLLDLASGTGDQIQEFMKRRKVKSCVALDMSRGMLAQAERKLAGTVTMVRASADAIPFVNDSFDTVGISFGIRNVVNLQSTLKEMHRVTKPGGECLILEFGIPKVKLVKIVYLLYFRHVMPIVGAILSKDATAYKYLNDSVERFPYDDDFVDEMKKAGFAEISFEKLSFGIAYLYKGSVR